MGRASSQKKVARAAGTGGGRTAGVKRPMGWYTTLAVVVVLGAFLVGFSRNEELNKSQTATKVAPRIKKDHWHSSLSVYICDHFAPNLPLFESSDGIHTHADGVLHIHPFSANASGPHATLGFYAKSVTDNGKNGPFKLSSIELKFPKVPGDANPLDSKDWHNGDSCPGKGPGKVKFTVNGKAITGDPASYRLRDHEYLDVGFLPDAVPLPSNPAEKQNLATITDVPTSTGTTTPVSPSTTAAGAPPGAPGATTPPAPDTSVAPPSTPVPPPAPPTTASAPPTT